MARLNVSAEEMEKRIARFGSLKPSKNAFVDTILPDHERDYFNVIGRGVTEDASLKPAISDVSGGFNLSYLKSMPGKRSALHDHDTVEVFVVLEGVYTFIWGDDGEHQVTLKALDVLSVPPGVMRCFRNDGDEEGLLLVVFGGTESGRVEWSAQTIAAAEKVGWKVDPSGDLVKLER